MPNSSSGGEGEGGGRVWSGLLSLLLLAVMAVVLVSAENMCSLLMQNVSSYYRMCPLTIECVLLLQNVFSYYRMCSLTTECVLLYRISSDMSKYIADLQEQQLKAQRDGNRMCSLTIECVLLL